MTGVKLLDGSMILSYIISYHIKTDLQEVGGGCGLWMELAQGRGRWGALVGTVMNFGFHKRWGIS